MSATGDLIARSHVQAWRATAPCLDLTSDDLLALLPTLYQSASVGLVWPRLREQIAPDGALGHALAAAYQAQAQANEQVASAVPRAVTRLRAMGIEPVLVKGWAISRRYPEPAVRLCGDIDLIVPQAAHEVAKAALFASDGVTVGAAVDLQGDPLWKGPGDPDLFKTSHVVMAGDVPVRVPSDEAHLRLQCLHLLIHGAMRPLWLCDVALMLEARSPDFDWEQCLGPDRRRRGWVLTVLRLAHEVLGADISGSPVEDVTLPRWLVPALLERWEQAAVMAAPVDGRIVLHPNELLRALRERWQDPIRATVTCGVPFNAFPRLPVQCAAFAIRTGQYMAERLARRAHSGARLPSRSPSPPSPAEPDQAG